MKKCMIFLLLLSMLLALPLSVSAEDEGWNGIGEEEELLSGVPYQYYYIEDERQSTAHVIPSEAEEGIVDISTAIDRALQDDSLFLALSIGTNVVTLNREAIRIVKDAMDAGTKPLLLFKKERGTENVTEEDLRLAEWIDPIFPLGYGKKDICYTMSIGDIAFPEKSVLIEVRHTPEHAPDLRVFICDEDGRLTDLKIVYKKGFLYFYGTESNEFFVTEKPLPLSKAPMLLAFFALACTIGLSVLLVIGLKKGTFKRWLQKKGTV